MAIAWTVTASGLTGPPDPDGGVREVATLDRDRVAADVGLRDIEDVDNRVAAVVEEVTDRAEERLLDDLDVAEHIQVLEVVLVGSLGPEFADAGPGAVPVGDELPFPLADP